MIAESLQLMLSRQHAPVAGDRRAAGRLACQGGDPNAIIGTTVDKINHVTDRIAVSAGKRVKRPRESWRQVLVEQKPQAARRISNSTAWRTASGSTSNHLATVSIDPSALTASARMAVCAPPWSMIGCPNWR